MRNKNLCFIYAKAIYSVASELRMVNDVKADIDFLDAIFKESGLKDKYYKVKEKGILFDNIWDIIERIEFKSGNIFINFLNVLKLNGRDNILFDLAECFNIVYRKNNNIGLFFVEHASELSEEQKTELKERIKKKFAGYSDYIILFKENRSLLAGFRIISDNFISDNSAAHYLKELKRELINN